jgi:sugar-specific transcriptional regulator TrmB
MATNLPPPEQALAALGFTEMEAAVYCELLRSGPATGYRLGQAIGKAAANTYQALASLTQKGAVLVDDREAKTYRATLPDELLSALERGFAGRRDQAKDALEALNAPAPDDRIYQLSTPAQVYERAAAMVERAQEIVLFDLFPAPLARLKPALTKAHARGVAVSGLVYGAPRALPFTAIASPSANVVAERWPGQQITLVADAREHLVALLAPDGQSVRHAVWSDSVYLACLKHSGLAAEIRVAGLAPKDQDPQGSVALLKAFPPGLRTLLGPADKSARKGDAA